MAPASQRLGALDLLRGLTIAAMIVVNNPGNWNNVYPQLTHAAWNGVTFADLVFPTFIFIMGMAMAMSLRTRLDRSGRRSMYRRIAVRASVLVLLGLVLNAASAWPALGAMRIPGVLQRIGLTYLAAALITSVAGDTQLAVVAVVLLALQWIVLFAPLGLPMSGGTEVGNNVGFAIDRAVFGNHLLTPAGDPEGLIGLLSSIATALIGALVARRLNDLSDRRSADLQVGVSGGPEGPHYARSTPGSAARATTVLAQLAIAGAAGIALGLVWSAILPFNKALWTGSFVLLSCGIATVTLALFMRAEREGTPRVLAPLAWLGLNPLAIYFLSELATDVLQREWFVVAGHPTAPKDWFYWELLVPLLHDAGGRGSSLTYALLYTLFWIGMAGLLKWQGIRLRA